MKNNQKAPKKDASVEKSNTKSVSDKKIEQFNLELSKLLKKYSINQHVCVFIIENREMLTFFPDLIETTKLLKSTYIKCKQTVINGI
jgi:hypothetical protein